MKRTLELLLFAVLIVAVPLACQAGSFPESKDGKYQAVKVDENGVHFKVVEKATGKKVFITEAQYPTPNDVKAGSFSDDGKMFAAAYHYKHDGDYTWIGVWSLETGKLLPTTRLEGFRYDIPDSVFKK